MNGVIENTIRLWLFLFSLEDKAKRWFQSLPASSITTWKFLIKFFSTSKSAQFWSEIGQFKQTNFQQFYKAWEKFKELLRRCRQHGYQNWMQVEIFYNVLNGQIQTAVDAASGGTLLSRTANDAYSLMNEIVTNNYQWPSERSSANKVTGLYEVVSITALSAKMSSPISQIATFTAHGNQ